MYEDNDESQSNVATFGAGCYWGTEKWFKVNLEKIYPGSIIQTSVGFMSPNPNAIQNPSYQKVCTGKTSHVEVCQVKFNPGLVSYEDLVKFFFTFHDPTTENAQGNDKGTQYASVIFYHFQPHAEIG